jgi:protein TonB
MSTAADPLLLPQRLKRRQVDGFEGRISRDRLSAMVVIAALLHGLVLLGVTFTAPGGRDDPQRALEVLLVSDELPEARDNEDAAYIAQRSQEGSGDPRERRAAELPGVDPQPAFAADADRNPRLLEDELLTTSAPALSTIRIDPAPEAELVLSQQELTQLLVGDDSLRLRGETREELYVSPDTRASRMAPWLHAWVQRVEQAGEAPTKRRGKSGSLLLEVRIRNDGQLLSARIQRSSGHADLDAAAQEILELASPFDPFPPDLARDFRTLRVAYEWQFEGGRSVGAAVRVP